MDHHQKDDGTTCTCFYTPRQGPFTLRPGQIDKSPPVFAEIKNFVAYKCRSHGIWVRGENMRILNPLLLNNLMGALLIGKSEFGNPLIIQGGRIIGETGNYGHRLNGDSRSRPHHQRFRPVGGLQQYDNRGGQYIRDVQFKNLITDSARPASAHAAHGGINVLYALNKMRSLTYQNSQTFYVEPGSDVVDQRKNVALQDIDGTTTGSYGTWITSNNHLQRRAGCVGKPDMNVQFCPRGPNQYVQLRIDNRNTGLTEFSGLHTDGSKEPESVFYKLGVSTNPMHLHGGNDNSMAVDVEARQKFSMKFLHPTPPQLRVSIDGAAPGEWVLVAIPFPDVAFDVKRGDANVVLTKVTSPGQLRANTYYYHGHSQHLYLKIEAPANSPQTSAYGFNTDNSWQSYVDVTASCSKSSCSTLGRPAPNINIPMEIRYSATLTGAQARPATSSNYHGSAWLHYDPTTRVLAYHVEHNMLDLVTSAAIHIGAAGTNGALQFNLRTRFSPITGARTLTTTQASHLGNGRFYILLNTNAHPAGELRGQFARFSEEEVEDVQFEPVEGTTATDAVEGLLQHDDDDDDDDEEEEDFVEVEDTNDFQDNQVFVDESVGTQSAEELADDADSAFDAFDADDSGDFDGFKDIQEIA
eukprot:JP446025.1.p1 GENE.JP446025.1~~JP446025.1.p1  ORF type:complete len:639 (-),score=200.50 JP446025.1:117-2033(-)